MSEFKFYRIWDVDNECWHTSVFDNEVWENFDEAIKRCEHVVRSNMHTTKHLYLFEIICYPERDYMKAIAIKEFWNKKN